MPRVTAYKLARPDGWDFYTGKTIQYRAKNYPHVVRVPNPNPKLGIRSNGVGHASLNPNDCFIGAKIPCSAYRLRFEPVCEKEEKWGWIEAEVLEEITDLDALFGWRYSEVLHPLNPFTIPASLVDESVLRLLERWDLVWSLVWSSVSASVGISVSVSVIAVTEALIQEKVGALIEAQSGGAVEAQVWAYIGSLFPNIQEWKFIPHKKGIYPFQPAVDLWRRGLVASCDGRMWRLHSGKDAKVVWAGKFQ